MLSRDPRDYKIVLQFPLFKEYDDNGFVKEEVGSINRTFWLKSVDGKFSRRYSTFSAPEWVMQIYNKHTRNEFKK